MMRFRVLFNQERIFLTSTEALREVLVTNSYDFIKPEQASFAFRKMLGDGILVANGANHKVRYGFQFYCIGLMVTNRVCAAPT